MNRHQNKKESVFKYILNAALILSFLFITFVSLHGKLLHILMSA